MNNQLINLQPDPLELSRTRSVTPMLKLIVVSMGGLTLALRIESAYKVVNHTSIHSNGLKSVGVAPVGEDEVTVVDLHRLFFKSSPRSESERGGYLVIDELLAVTSLNG
jgi:purine-binding chemotaxis protein CheW